MLSYFDAKSLPVEPAEGSDVSNELRPFRAEVPQADLDDLHARLGAVRWPDELPGGRYGVSRDYVSELVEHWRTAFDWRAQEARLNAQPQFVTTIDGQSVHFIHVRSPEPDALALICTHGWPMSVFEYVDLIGPLTDPQAHGGDVADAFDVVIPSLPGIAFSGPTTEPGWDSRRVARAWVELMDGLGYERYGAHGNDAGSMVSPEVGRIAPDRVAGVHVTQLFSFPSGDPAEFADMSEEDMAALKFLEEFTGGGGLAYNQYQSAQPQTISYALQDSPAGWLAWVCQLFREWGERDYILANASAYWLTNTIGSSIRRYYDDAHAGHGPSEPTTVPTGVAIFAEDFQTVRKLAERDHNNIVSWNRYERGSHFSPHDAPDLLVDDIRAFFRPLR
jgi:pimeloyl-ACP methyl ester carboxylesterase